MVNIHTVHIIYILQLNMTKILMKRKIGNWGLFIEIDNLYGDTFEVILPEKINKLIWKHLHELQKQDKLPTEHDTQGKILW